MQKDQLDYITDIVWYESGAHPILDEVGMPKIARGKKQSRTSTNQLSLFRDEKDAVVDEIRKVDPMDLTPLDALQRISSWKERLK